jgi:hypothetical protein
LHRGRTDAAIDTDLDVHVAINPAPAVTAKQRLLVFMPGTSAKQRRAACTPSA